MNHRRTLLKTTLFSCLVAGPAAADYQIDLVASSRAHQPTGDFTFIPAIDAREDGAATDAVVQLTSPNGFFFGAENLSGPGATGSRLVASLSDVTDELNGTWRVSVEDDGSTFDYDVDVGFSFPFQEHPYLASTSIVDGKPAGVLDWRVEGGSAVYPGASTTFWARLFEQPSSAQLDSEVLPFTTTTWTPQADLTVADNFRALIIMSNGTDDLSSFQVTDVRSLTAGAPALSLGQLSVEYSASLSATLTAPVPEPAAAMLVAGAMFAGGLPRVRRNPARRPT